MEIASKDGLMLEWAIFISFFFIDCSSILGDCSGRGSEADYEHPPCGAEGQRSSRDRAPPAARRRRPPEGGRAHGRVEVLNALEYVVF